MIYANSTVLGQQGQSMSPGNSPAPQTTPSTPGKIITPKETHLFMNVDDDDYEHVFQKIGWKITKGSIYRPSPYTIPQIRSIDGEFEMQYQLSDDDIDSLLRYDGQIQIYLNLGNSDQLDLKKDILDVYLRIPESIATERLPPSRIPPATPDKPYLVAAYRVGIVIQGRNSNIAITNPADQGVGVSNGSQGSFINTNIMINTYNMSAKIDESIDVRGLSRTDLSIPEGVICVRSAPNQIDNVAIYKFGFSFLHEPPEYTLSPDDNGATIYIPYACNRYRVTIPDQVFPKGFSVAVLGSEFDIFTANSNVALTRKEVFYPDRIFHFTSYVGQLTQTGDDGKTWVTGQ